MRISCWEQQPRLHEKSCCHTATLGGKPWSGSWYGIHGCIADGALVPAHKARCTPHTAHSCGGPCPKRHAVRIVVRERKQHHPGAPEKKRQLSRETNRSINSQGSLKGSFTFRSNSRRILPHFVSPPRNAVRGHSPDRLKRRKMCGGLRHPTQR